MKTIPLLCAALLAAPAWAQTAPGAAPDAVVVAPSAELLLGAIDVPLTDAGLARAGVTEPVALAVAADGQRRRYLRARAVAATARFRTPQGRALLERLAAHDADHEIRIQAIISLARAFGPADPAGVGAALDALAPGAPDAVRALLDAERARLRASTAAK